MDTQQSAKPKSYTFTAAGLEEPLRLDQAIVRFLPDVSRGQARRLIALGAAWVNKQRVQVQSRKVHNEDRVLIYEGREGWKMFYDADPVRILYEDDWLLLYCKESGIPTQGIFCDNYNNLYAGLLRMLKKRGRASYLGLHHRLDLETSGVVLFTKNKQANRSIHYQFKNRSVQKNYLALVTGNRQAALCCLRKINRPTAAYITSLKNAVCRKITWRWSRGIPHLMSMNTMPRLPKRTAGTCAERISRASPRKPFFRTCAILTATAL
jgi:23S rRNA-/tRNA-specific pseudouridylate synthase